MADKFRIIIILLLASLSVVQTKASEGFDLQISVDAAKAAVPADSINIDGNLKHDWMHMIKTRRIQVTDTNVVYPKFIDWCLRVYRWAEKTFNTYDPEYVSGTGKHGKVRLLSDNWTDLYYFRFKEVSPLIMASNPYCNLGIQANYSILSASYSVDINSALTGIKSKHRKWGFSFTTARLYGEAYYWRNHGSTVIRRFGDENTGRLYHVGFDGINFKAFGAMGFYIFNSKKFSYAAAYNLSNYQLKSAGSWIIGASGTVYDCDFDFTKLPQEVLDVTKLPFNDYRFDYNSINILGGYAYNWVINRHFLFNVTTLPGLGISFCFANDSDDRKNKLSLAVRHMTSLTYTNRQFFITATSNFYGNFLLTHKVGFMTAIENFQFSTGIRF